MIYHSTRDEKLTAAPTRAVLEGIAPDGGLYVCDPGKLDFDWQGTLQKDTMSMAADILGVLLPDFQDMNELVRASYAGKFASDDLTPLVPVGERYVLEPGTRIMVFYPAGGVSPVQEAQMVTQEGGNVRVCAIRGNFDDAQTGVKNVFAACKGKDLHGAVLSSANSINIGRLAPQVVYYFRAYADLVQAGRIRVGEKVHFVVPTGNFGDILAGYFAKRMGLPVGRLVCASNANDVLTEFISTGVYDRRRPFYKTTSPSMDILVSSNLERLLYLLSEGDCGYVAGLMEQLNREGHYQVSPQLLERLQAEFDCACCDDAGAAEVIRRLWQEQHYLCDPHTAVAWSAAEQVRLEDGAPVMVLSTASPYKFPAAVLGALEGGCDGDEFAMMERLHRLTGTEVPRNLAGLQGRPVRHRDVIDKEQMLDYVLAEVMRS